MRAGVRGAVDEVMSLVEEGDLDENSLEEGG